MINPFDVPSTDHHLQIDIHHPKSNRATRSTYTCLRCVQDKPDTLAARKQDWRLDNFRTHLTSATHKIKSEDLPTREEFDRAWKTATQVDGAAPD